MPDTAPHAVPLPASPLPASPLPASGLIDAIRGGRGAAAC